MTEDFQISAGDEYSDIREFYASYDAKSMMCRHTLDLTFSDIPHDNGFKCEGTYQDMLGCGGSLREYAMRNGENIDDPQWLDNISEKCKRES